VVVALVLFMPLAFLLIEAHGVGRSELVHDIVRPLTATLLWNTVRLMVVVTALCAVIGVATAWCIERTDLPGRRLWAIVVVLPVAIPDFVVAFGWSSLTTWMQGFHGAVVVMTLAVYPLVYLPVAASLRGADPGQEEVARSLGVGRLKTFWTITLGQARGAILGGCLLASLVLLAEYGAFEILGYRTFTTEIFTEFNSFNVSSACALSLVLVVLSFVVLGGDTAARGRASASRSGALAQRMATPARLGRATVPVVAAMSSLVVLSVGVPIGACVYWILRGGHVPFTGESLAAAAGHTALYSGSAAALATAMALPVALLSIRHANRGTRLLERSTYIVLAVPGLVVALALSYFTEHYAGGHFYQSAPLLVLAYAIVFFPLALVCVRASVSQAPVSFEEVGRSLGLRRKGVLWRVTLPLVVPGLVTGFCLVFLSAVTELTATLLLVPTGVQTLATQFWAYQQNLAYAQAAPFALAMIVIAGVPSVILERWFDRLPSRAAVAT
jgi:iron(III) transport system permease protein